LEESQKKVLFFAVNELPDPEQMKKVVVLTRLKDTYENKDLKSFISKGLLKTITNTYKKANLSEEEIEKEIKYYCETQKKMKIQEIEKMMG